MNQLTEQQWIRRWQEGSSEAFTILYQKYARDVYQYIYLLMPNRSLAEEIVQETFIRVLKNKTTFDPKKAQFRTWIHRIAYHLFIDEMRKEAKSKRVSLQEVEHRLKSFQTEEMIEQKMIIQQCLNLLDEPNRSVLILAYFQGFKGKEIAQILHLPLGTVKSKLHYSIQFLKNSFREGSVHEPKPKPERAR
ncbi:RNA polymerase sigma factor [Hazenella coriacea]|uniref:RNA polymerase sigma factor n=1 Tax=Hazenella coriacea TaxID=1179467 RepID=A0A4R3LHL1_9BACL|nr:sigma-70 family RNA polymerase sigma factor [Hazenella coriacea]TCS97006.1 RNA polymerase sigma-70 factor (ECF subfamily) [Hazenella coriacea]